jgi:2-hydroxychromene-2-carboxylate isomerase
VIECFFDCSSPWTWLGFHNLQPIAAEFGETVKWRPILVGGIFNSVNPSVYANRQNPVPAKQAYTHKDLQDWAGYSGLTINFPPVVFPVNSVKVMRGCIWLEPQGLLVPFAQACFEAYWSHRQDISKDEVLASICTRLGIDPVAFSHGVTTPAIKDALKANTDELMARGGFGSPTFFVDGDMFFGNDRLPLVRHRLATRRG